MHIQGSQLLRLFLSPAAVVGIASCDGSAPTPAPAIDVIADVVAADSDAGEVRADSGPDDIVVAQEVAVPVDGSADAEDSGDATTVPDIASPADTTDAADTGTGPRCRKSPNLSTIAKPTGVYTSVLTAGAATHPAIQGGLIRVPWADLEPTPGVFDFTAIESRLALLPEGKSWSLAIHGGWTSVDLDDPDLYTDATLPNGQPRPAIALQMSPPWLVTTEGAVPFETEFRQVTVQLPKYWDPIVKTHLKNMLQAVAAQYASDPRLKLVYVPQMTLNGIEGHFNGVSNDTLIAAAGIDITASDAGDRFENIWVSASLGITKLVVSAFPTKAVAFEVHEVIGRASIPERIMNAFLLDPHFQYRAGIAMWWISGDDDYQPALVELIRAYEGDLYGQVIASSDQPTRYTADGYAAVFAQAKDLCMRYIEPWNYEFENATYDAVMADFNAFTAAAFQ